MTVPTVWQFVLIALGTYRLWRIAARDSITEEAREALTGYDDEAAPPLEPGQHSPRRYLSALIRCAWCLGFWLSLGVTASWWVWPHVTLLAAVPLALSASLGMLRKNLDA